MYLYNEFVTTELDYLIYHRKKLTCKISAANSYDFFMNKIVGMSKLQMNSNRRLCKNSYDVFHSDEINNTGCNYLLIYQVLLDLC